MQKRAYVHFLQTNRHIVT